MSTDIDRARLQALAQRYTAAAPAQTRPTFTLYLGIITPDDRSFCQEQSGGRDIPLNLLDIYACLSGEAADTFHEAAWRDTMFLAGLIGINAFHQKQNIACEIGALESGELEKILMTMKMLGYTICTTVLSDGDPGGRYRSMSEHGQWLCYIRDNAACGIIAGLFQDIIGQTPEALLAACGGAADRIILSDGDGNTISNLPTAEITAVFAPQSAS